MSTVFKCCYIGVDALVTVLPYKWCATTAYVTFDSPAVVDNSNGFNTFQPTVEWRNGFWVQLLVQI
jgi:hypothetical protein